MSLRLKFSVWSDFDDANEFRRGAKKVQTQSGNRGGVCWVIRTKFGAFLNMGRNLRFLFELLNIGKRNLNICGHVIKIANQLKLRRDAILWSKTKRNLKICGHVTKIANQRKLWNAMLYNGQKQTAV